MGNRVQIGFVELIFAVLAAMPFSFASAQQDVDNNIHAFEYIEETALRAHPYGNPFLRLRPDLEGAKIRLRNFPAQEAVDVPNRTVARELCQPLWGTMYWWRCDQDLAGVTINKTLLDQVMALSRTPHYDLADDLLLAGANRYFNSQAIEVFRSFVTDTNFPALVQIMADARFDLDLAPLCNTRYNPLANVGSPLTASRRLNQRSIFNCIWFIRNREVAGWRKARIQPCKAHTDLGARMNCLRQALNDPN